jgi:hypothetical protein
MYFQWWDIKKEMLDGLGKVQILIINKVKIFINNLINHHIIR